MSKGSMMRTKTKAVPRGIRNNNPLNIVIGNTWLGERDNPTDTRFEEFVSMKYGLRAGFIILRRYIRRYGRNTIRAIISSWCPDGTALTYAQTVSRRMSWPLTEVVDYANKKQMCDLVEAMAYVECGQPIDYAVIEQAYDMA